MRPTKIAALAALAAISTVLSLLLQRMLRASGWTMPPVPWTAAVGLLLVACLVYSAALPVRRMLSGGVNARPVEPLRAARTAVLAKATAYAGAVVTGWYLAQVLLLVPDLEIDTRQAQAVRAGVTALAALAACVAGLLAERMCRLPPEDPDKPGGLSQTGGAGRTGGVDGPGDVDVTDEVRRHE